MPTGLLVMAVAMVAGLAVLTLVMGMRALVVGGAGDLSSRLSRYGATERGPAVETLPTAAPRRRFRLTMKPERLIQGLNQAVEKQNFAENLRRRLARADLKITVGEFMIVNAAAVIVGAAIGYVVFGTPIHLAIFVFAGAVLPHWYLRIRRKGRIKKFQNQLPDCIAMLANSLRSGYSILSAMDLVSREMGAPIADEFHRVTAEIGLGLVPEDALANLARRVQSEDLQLMITAMNIQRDVGGNLAEILDIIANTIRERVRLQGEIRALTAQQTMAGYIITALPIFLAFVIYSLDHAYMATFWTWVPCGWIMAGVSIVMMIIGYFAMRKIVAIDV